MAAKIQKVQDASHNIAVRRISQVLQSAWQWMTALRELTPADAGISLSRWAGLISKCGRSAMPKATKPDPILPAVERYLAIWAEERSAISDANPFEIANHHRGERPEGLPEDASADPAETNGRGEKS
jgi:hypothetical protein